jgi:hypothetical protein
MSLYVVGSGSDIVKLSKGNKSVAERKYGCWKFRDGCEHFPSVGMPVTFVPSIRPLPQRPLPHHIIDSTMRYSLFPHLVLHLTRLSTLLLHLLFLLDHIHHTTCIRRHSVAVHSSLLVHHMRFSIVITYSKRGRKGSSRSKAGHRPRYLLPLLVQLRAPWTAMIVALMGHR